nr:VWFA and cache domain-containing protein 1 [Leptinotarsa decemlineata]
MDILKILYKFVVISIFFSIPCTTSDLDIKEVARSITLELSSLKDDELGVPFILDLYKNYMMQPMPLDFANVVNTIAQRLEKKIENIFSLLENSKIMMDVQLTTQNITNMFSTVTPCFRKSFEGNKNGSHDEVDKISDLTSTSVLEQMGQKLSVAQDVKRQYFISDLEVKKLGHTPFLYCNGCDETIVWDNYIQRNIYQRRNVVLVLDIGGSVKPSLFQILRSLAKKIISVLTSDDRIAFMTISSNYSFIDNDCGRMKDQDITSTIPRLMAANSSYLKILNNYIDAIVSESDFTISFTKGWKTNDYFFMLGTDIRFSHLAEDLMNYSGNQDYSYVFMIAKDGSIVFHPYYSQSIDNAQFALPVNLESLEKTEDVTLLKRKLLTEKSGMHETRKDNQTDLEGAVQVLRKHFRGRGLIALLDDVSSLYLSPSCFQSPYTAQHKMNSHSFIPYLKDTSRTSVNPGLKENIRSDVSLVYQVLKLLKERHMLSPTSNYIVRRYASSNSGVFQMFPGSVLKPGWTPVKNPWYYKAWQHEGKVVLIPPHSDRGGAGHVVTVAYATSQLVVAMDITYGYMLKLLVKHVPSCLKENITCFIVDDEGYVIYHPDLRNQDGAKPVEHQHIVHKESLVSNDILNHKYFMKKLLCNSYGDNTIQRYYKLNTSYTDVLVNFVPGEHCVTYQVTSVPDTNIFVGIVNTSCNFGATFCPCSIVDRLCLNCNRMEQKECECPCECPLDRGEFCDANLANWNRTNNLPCRRYEEDSLDSSFIVNTKTILEPCFPIRCYAQKSHMDCLGLLGCEWCTYDADRNYLRDPFCAELTTCLNGVYDASEIYVRRIPSSDFPSVVPILGSIVAITIVFVLLLICYRSYTHRVSERFYISSTQDQLRMSDLNITDNFHDLGNHRDKLLQEEHPNVISPYCVASTYRRPVVPADSDHGYSTMTPHDESEHMSLAPVEIESLEDETTSDNTSVHINASVKEVPGMFSPMFTRIPQKNCITVPVTVHRHMEKT